MQQQESELCTLHAMAEAECKKLRAEIEGLRKVLAPFAAFEQVRSTMGRSTPKEGLLWAVEARIGRAEITVEDMKAAVYAIVAAKGGE